MRVGRAASAQLMETARVARFLQCRNSTPCIGIGIGMRTQHLAIVAASTCEPPPTQAEFSAQAASRVKRQLSSRTNVRRCTYRSTLEPLRGSQWRGLALSTK
jgi:hypothetical protein